MTGRYLVGLDIDGTLVSWGHSAQGLVNRASEPVKEAVLAAASAGHHLILATGRSVYSTLQAARLFGSPFEYAVCSNGAATVRIGGKGRDGRNDGSCRNGVPGGVGAAGGDSGFGGEDGFELLDLRTFDATHVVGAIHEALPQVAMCTEVVGVGFKATPGFPGGELDGEITVVDFPELTSQPVTRVVVRSVDHSVDEFSEAIERLGLHGVSTAMGWTAWLDITPHGVSKASALEDLRHRLGVEPHLTVAIGDGSNDHEMLRWAARGVAMGQADATTRACADEVTGTVTEDGVVPVLRSLLG